MITSIDTSGYTSYDKKYNNQAKSATYFLMIYGERQNRGIGKHTMMQAVFFCELHFREHKKRVSFPVFYMEAVEPQGYMRKAVR